VSELEWFSDPRCIAEEANFRLGHYHYQATLKRSGAIRLIEAPTARIKTLQRKILNSILDRIPAYPAVHGFVRGRSIQTFVLPHVGRPVVLRMDVRDFFPSFTVARARAFFRTAGYGESVAHSLGGLCTHSVPRALWNHLPLDVAPVQLRENAGMYEIRHLPQGAPTSPALANICSYRLDCRLTGLAKSAGAGYTRSADDLAFSGDEPFERGVERFSPHVAAILIEEGFHAHHHKTRVMRQGTRQYLAGLVANSRVNIVRADFDRLKAILHNCVRNGPAGQNRDGHSDLHAPLRGRIAFVESVHPEKGERLRRQFDRIPW
jgi:RNA-directed DNA polymerase